MSLSSLLPKQREQNYWYSVRIKLTSCENGFKDRAENDVQGMCVFGNVQVHLAINEKGEEKKSNDIL